MSEEKDYTLDKIKNIHSFMNKSKFSKIYDVFRKPCENFIGDQNDSCYKDTFERIEGSPRVTNLLKELYSNLYRAYQTIKYSDNTYFDNIECTDYKLCYTSLKYWLYDQIIIKNLKQTEINEIFTGLENQIKKKIKNIPSNSCVFNELTLDEIKKLRKIYALYTVLYNNNENFENCINDKCKYIDYFGERLDEFISSINSCFSNTSTINYCNELKEFIDLCKEDNKDAGISIYLENTKSKAKSEGKHLLSVQRYDEEQLYIYLKNQKLINFVRTSHFLNNKNSTTVAATSIAGSAIGLSSIFYYLYKVNLNLI
ncbi:hypothetical protein PVIIG_05675 [Plasmodium vivax India VII]|uniref:VIR protein n=1 Tax=Plasmodium vivax India VII TaxID=1077284 RepID=A0A0J9S296_PLAVI|nr:hypothetical protein PVIIG_05675 [Plasmodium vivax India VII]